MGKIMADNVENGYKFLLHNYVFFIVYLLEIKILMAWKLVLGPSKEVITWTTSPAWRGFSANPAFFYK